MASGPPLEAKGTDLSRAGRGTSHPGEIIPDWWATSSRNSGRNYLGMAGGIIPESWAASTGIGTSARVKGKTWWQWAFGCATAVYFVIAETRGKCVPTAFLAGARPKMWLSDRLPAQLRHAEEHQFCLAHLIRDAQYAIDHGDTIFAPDFKALLKDACAVGRRRPNLADATIAAHR